MLTRCWLVASVMLSGVMAVSSVAISQDRDGERRDNDGERRDRDGDGERRRDGDNDGERRDRDNDGERRRDGDGERRSRDIDPRDIIRMADDNNDGVIDPSEVGSRSGYYIRRAAERGGLDATKPIPVDKLMPALEAMRSERSGGSPASSSSSSASASPAGAPAVAGFGAPDTAPKAVGFNVPLTVNSAAPIAQRFDQRVIDYVNEMLRERDVNKNGILEKNEWTGRWSTPAADSDTNKDGVLDMQELCVRISNRFNIGRPGSVPTTTATPSSSASTSTATPATSTPPSSSSAGNDGDRYRRYAEGFIRQYDTNKDGKLDKEESSRMRPEHQSADVNKDGIVTQDEMQAKLQSYASNSSAGSSSSSGRDGERDGGRDGRDGGRRGYGSRGPSDGDKAPAGPRKSFRITTNSDRLPKGLPDWFLRSDGNGDGQVSMAEYTTSWTEQLAAEFAKTDLNGDGIITPSECAVPEKSR